MDMKTIIFIYGSESVNFSPCEEYAIRAGSVAYKFENNVKCFKPTDERWLEIISKDDITIARGTKGELLLYETEDSGTIWQASFDGRELSDSENEWVYKFSGTQA
jgi:hypothetical protein